MSLLKLLHQAQKLPHQPQQAPNANKPRDRSDITSDSSFKGTSVVCFKYWTNKAKYAFMKRRAISELLEYREGVKENDHTVDALRYSLPFEQEKKPFLYVGRR